MKADEQAIRDLHSRWIAAVNAGDLSGLLRMMAEDVVFVGPGQAPFGQEGFIRGFSGAHEQSLVNCVSELQEVMVSGQLAYARAEDSLSITPRAGGEPMRFAGHRLTVYRSHSDGHWLLARDAHTVIPVSTGS